MDEIVIYIFWVEQSRQFERRKGKDRRTNRRPPGEGGWTQKAVGGIGSNETVETGFIWTHQGQLPWQNDRPFVSWSLLWKSWKLVFNCFFDNRSVLSFREKSSQLKLRLMNIKMERAMMANLKKHWKSSQQRCSYLWPSSWTTATIESKNTIFIYIFFFFFSHFHY